MLLNLVPKSIVDFINGASLIWQFTIEVNNVAVLIEQIAES